MAQDISSEYPYVFSDIGHVRYYLLYLFISGNGDICVTQGLASKYSYVLSDIGHVPY